MNERIKVKKIILLQNTSKKFQQKKIQRFFGFYFNPQCKKQRCSENGKINKWFGNCKGNSS